jgi:tetratricopeptide (TPR) repeat protein
MAQLLHYSSDEKPITFRGISMKASNTSQISFLKTGSLYILSLFILLILSSNVIAQTIQSSGEHIDRADTLIAQGQIDQAILEYDKAIKLVPQSSNLYYKRGRAWFAKRLKVEIKADQLKDTVTFKEAIRKQFQESLDKAISDFDKSIKLNPDLPEAYIFRGAAKEEKGEAAEALKDYNKAVAVSPQSSEAYYTRGLFKQKRKEYQAAIEDYNKAISLDPKQAGFYAGRGLLLLQMGKENEANSDFNQCLLLDSKWKPILDKQIGLIKAAAKK